MIAILTFLFAFCAQVGQKLLVDPQKISLKAGIKNINKKLGLKTSL